MTPDITGDGLHFSVSWHAAAREVAAEKFLHLKLILLGSGLPEQAKVW